jgi:hypothetical protein
MTVGRISQTAVEVLLQQQPHIRLGQQAVEILRSTALAGGPTIVQPVMILYVSA